MQVNIITFHFVHNVGAVLQCLALQKKLEALNYKVEIINYQPSYHKRRYGIWINPFIMQKENCLESYKLLAKIKNNTIEFLRKSIANRKIFINYYRFLSFKKFRKKNLNLGIKCTSNLELKLLYSDFNQIFICGSDQIWNSELMEKSFDPAYFLKFAPEQSVKIAYAASAGNTNLHNNTLFLIYYLKNYSGISLREEENAKELTKILSKNTFAVMDPSFLLTYHDYIEYEQKVSQIKNKKYILVYALEQSDILVHAINKLIGKNNNLHLVNVSQYKIKGINHKKIINLLACGPGEFLTCIKNAECVVTNSFHGTAFSIIYQKKFYSVNSINGSQRILNLLKKIHLENRLINRENIELANIDIKIDYNYIDIFLHKEIEASKNFLIQSLVENNK